MPSSSDSSVVAQYSMPMGLVFVFNLIVGTGALAMPKAFQEAGYVLGLVTITILALMSYISLTFVVESMSAANAVLESQRVGKLKVLALQFASENPTMRSSSNPDLSSSAGLRSPSGSSRSMSSVSRPQFFEIAQRVEFGRMASMFLNKWGVRFFYACLTVYLYGDLSIYATAVPKSMMNVVCTYRPPIDGHNGTAGGGCSSAANITNDEPCWANVDHFWTRFTVYRFLVITFALLIGPWVFFNVSKTKYLQTFSTASRWIAFVLMISLASVRLADHEPDLGNPPIADVTHFGNLFGICVYAFMCQHSLPSVITPMRSKSHLFPLTGIVYALILSFYITLSMTGSFAFARVMDVYTLNFLHQQCDSSTNGLDSDGGNGATHVFLLIVEYFLALFPVFTLSMTFPVVGITLRNNIQALLFGQLIKKTDDQENTDDDGTLDPASVEPSSRNHRNHPEVIDESGEENALIRSSSSSNEVSTVRDRCLRYAHNLGVPFVVLVIPVTVALASDNVEILTSITGSYAGVGVQYVMPSLLVWSVRRRLPRLLGDDEEVPRGYASPFRARGWVYLLWVWAAMTVIVVTVNHIVSGV